MKFVYALNIFMVQIAVLCLMSINMSAQRSADVNAGGGPQLIQPEELVEVLQSAKGPKPLIIQVGFRVLYLQAHIPGSEYIGPASSAEAIQQLRKRVQALQRGRSILLYCGCCPWDKCPNVNPAYKELRTMGFKNVKVLYVPHNFGTDWVEKGYLVAKGE